jgi:uncharacterized membrane protein YdjX (TVP38/TMEM64 family)
MENQSTAKSAMKSVLVLVLLIVLIAAVYLSGLNRLVDFSDIKARADSLRDLARHHYAASIAIFILVYIVTTLTLPTAAVLSMLGGFLYGTLLGAVYANVGITVGATVAFLASRYIIGRWLQGKYGSRIAAVNGEIERYGRWYLLSIRLFPLLPLFVKNLLIGLTRVSVKDFVWTTSLGSFPGTLVFTYLGRQLVSLQSADDILSPRVMIALLLLIIMAAAPVAVRVAMAYVRR